MNACSYCPRSAPRASFILGAFVAYLCVCGSSRTVALA